MKSGNFKLLSFLSLFYTISFRFSFFAFSQTLRETFSVQTVVTKSPAVAAEFIRQGGTVAFPTETVYGLGANVFDAQAVEKIFAAKRRPPDNPLIAHVGRVEDIKLLAAEVPAIAARFIRAFFPAPLTLVLPKAEKVPLIATAGLTTIGVRMPRHDLAARFLQSCGTPVVAPSANLSGKPSPTTWQAVLEDLRGEIDCILQGEISEIGLESTVLDCTGEIPLVLRSGGVTIEQLRAIEPQTRLYHLQPGEQPRSPGLRHRHYAPRAAVELVRSAEFEVQKTGPAAFIGLDAPETELALVEVCRSVEEYAHALFDFFRRCDHENIRVIYCQAVAEKGLGLALMDRIKRAAEG